MKKINALVLSLALFSTLSSAQTGGSYTMTKSVIAGGGGQASGGSYTMTSTIGQSIAGNATTGGNYRLLPGFWSPDSLNKTPFDFDGDGKSDVGIFRPSDGSWWINRSTAGIFVAAFGRTGDRPTPADYTGDGSTDVAVWRPSDGNWYVLRSENSSYFALPFGQTGDIPVAADYDGDGTAEVGVFRPGNNVWYVNRNRSGLLIQQFGANGDVPVPKGYSP